MDESPTSPSTYKEEIRDPDPIRLWETWVRQKVNNLSKMKSGKKNNLIFRVFPFLV